MLRENFVIRAVRRTEIDLIMEWAASEGWNPGIYDGECFYQASKHGFLVGLLDKEPIGFIAATAYGESFGFLGLYIVKPSFRGKGYGIQLWQAAIDSLGTERNIGLDGVVAQQRNYEKSGFKLAYRHIRYEGVSGGRMPGGLIKLSDIPINQVIEYDSRCFPAERAIFLRCWLQQPENVTLGILQGESLAGYGMIRPSYLGYRIGPLLADNAQIAADLWQGLMASVPETPVAIDIPDSNSEAIALAQHYHLQPVFGTARMYTQAMPPLPLEKIFGVTSLELG